MNANVPNSYNTNYAWQQSLSRGSGSRPCGQHTSFCKTGTRYRHAFDDRVPCCVLRPFTFGTPITRFVQIGFGGLAGIGLAPVGATDASLGAALEGALPASCRNFLDTGSCVVGVGSSLSNGGDGGGPLANFRILSLKMLFFGHLIIKFLISKYY